MKLLAPYTAGFDLVFLSMKKCYYMRNVNAYDFNIESHYKWFYHRNPLKTEQRTVSDKLDWLIDFNGMTTHLWLFYAQRSRSWVFLVVVVLFCFGFFFFCFLLLFFFGGGDYTQLYQVFLSDTNNSNRSLWLLVGTLTSTNTPCQSGPGSNGNEKVLLTPKISRTRTSPSNVV